MFLIIVLNVLFAALVLGGIVGLLGHSIWTSRTTIVSAVPAHRAAAHPAHAPDGRRRGRARALTATS